MVLVKKVIVITLLYMWNLMVVVKLLKMPSAVNVV